MSKKPDELKVLLLDILAYWAHWKTQEEAELARRIRQYLKEAEKPETKIS